MIRNLNVNKAHGHDDIPIRMTKKCDESLVRPLSIIFRYSLNSCINPSNWKEVNVIRIHKKDGKECTLENFAKLIFNEVYSFLDKEKLLNTNQLGFQPSDSCVNQLLIITHKIFFSFDSNPSLEVCSIFLDI